MILAGSENLTQKWIGQEGQPLAIFDDFVPDPETLHLAAAQGRLTVTAFFAME